MDIKAPTEFCKPSVTVVEDSTYKDSSHEVYFVYKEGTFDLLYVGCGKRGRHKHVFSGSSQNVMLNVCFVLSIDLKIYVFGCKSKEEALAREIKGIEELSPEFNNVARDQIPSIKGKGKLVIKGVLGHFKLRSVPLKTIVALYETDKEECQRTYPEWFLVFEELGTDICKSYKYDKNKVKSLYDRAIQEKSPDLQAAVTRFFKVGSTYSAKDIKQTLRNMGLENAKGTSLAKWFHTKRVNSNGVMSYRILGRVTDSL